MIITLIMDGNKDGRKRDFRKKSIFMGRGGRFRAFCSEGDLSSRARWRVGREEIRHPGEPEADPARRVR